MSAKSVICSICNTHLDLDQHPAMVRVIGWVDIKNGTTYSGVVKGASEALGFAHRVCIETQPAKDQTPTLF